MNTTHPVETVEQIFLKYNTDKNKTFHNYSRQYEDLFKKYREKPVKYLELGVFGGQSLLAMRGVFPNAICVCGVDITQSCSSFADEAHKIYVEIGDATRKEVIARIHQKYGGFDIILDDASHRNCDVIKAFELLFPLLNDNGLYIVEDTICYNWSSYIDRNYPNHLDYFYRFVPFLNQSRQDNSTSGIRDNCIDPFKIQKKTGNVFEYSIDKIEFGCSFIAIHKLIRSHWI